MSLFRDGPRLNVKTSLTLSIIPNGLTVEMTNRAEKFMVPGARAWAEAIGRARRPPVSVNVKRYHLSTFVALP
jgi:hypothetical protein